MENQNTGSLPVDSAVAAMGKIDGDDGNGVSSYQVPNGLTGTARPSGQTT